MTTRVPVWVAPLLRCPACAGELTLEESDTHCSGQHRFPVSDGVPLFAMKTTLDKYDDRAYVERYAQYSFGYCVRRHDEIFGRGDSEALYRTVSELTLREVLSRSLENPLIVDVGCGVGRTVRDIGEAVRHARVLGFDYSLEMARFASAACAGRSVRLGCADDGYPIVEQHWPALENVWIAQGDARCTPLRGRLVGGGDADIVLVSMLLDRLYDPSDVEAVLAGAKLALKTGGLLILSTPFNWISAGCWQRFGESRGWLVKVLESMDYEIEIAFDGLKYREMIDPFGAALELPVAVISGRRSGENSGRGHARS